MKTVEENYFRLLNYLLIKNYNNIWHVEKPISEQPKRGQPISGRPTDKIFLWEKRIGAASRARPAGEKITSNQIENNGPTGRRILPVWPNAFLPLVVQLFSRKKLLSNSNT